MAGSTITKARIDAEESGVVRVGVGEDTPQTAEEAQQIILGVKDASPERTAPIVLDIRQASEMTAECLAVLTGDDTIGVISALAILTNPGARLDFLNYLIERSEFPLRVRAFSDEGEASNWCSQFLHAGPVTEDEAQDLPAELTVLVYESNTQLQKAVIRALIEMGIRCEAVKQKKDIFKKLQTKLFPVFVCSYSPNQPDMLWVMERIKNDPEIGAVKVFAHSPSTSKDNFLNLVKIGVSGILIKPFDPRQFHPKFMELLHKINMGIDKRQHIRVEPRPADKAQIMFRHPTSYALLAGEIKNISMIGVSFYLSSDSDDEELQERLLVEDATVILKGARLKCNLQIVAKRKKFVAVRIAAMADDNKTRLSGYIYDYIREKSEETQRLIEKSKKVRESGFDILQLFDEKTLQTILGKINQDTLAMALIGAPAETVDKVIANLPTRLGILLKDSLDQQEGEAPEGVKPARDEISAVIAQMVREGEIFLPR